MTSLDRRRRDKDEWLRTSPDSPIPDRSRFVALDYFDPDPDLRFEVTPDPGDGSEITIQTSDDRQRIYTRDLVARIDIDGHPVSLTLYGTPHGLFLPFRDATSGSETYGAGRYLDIRAPGRSGTVTIDFNQAYNPFCAYDDRYSCPVPPPENRIEVPVRAGEKAFRP